MTQRNTYHGTRAEYETAREQRNAEVRAWGKEQIADTNPLDTLLGVPTELLNVTDWDQLVSQTIQNPDVSETIQKPKTPKTPKPKAE